MKLMTGPGETYGDETNFGLAHIEICFCTSNCDYKTASVYSRCGELTHAHQNEIDSYQLFQSRCARNGLPNHLMIMMEKAKRSQIKSRNSVWTSCIGIAMNVIGMPKNAQRK